MRYGIRKPGTTRTQSYQGIAWVWIGKTPPKDFATYDDAEAAAEMLTDGATSKDEFEVFEIPDEAP